jgi:hypothetical protein
MIGRNLSGLDRARCRCRRQAGIRYQHRHIGIIMAKAAMHGEAAALVVQEDTDAEV